jgi:hypothetical protein
MENFKTNTINPTSATSRKNQPLNIRNCNGKPNPSYVKDLRDIADTIKRERRGQKDNKDQDLGVHMSEPEFVLERVGEDNSGEMNCIRRFGFKFIQVKF